MTRELKLALIVGFLLVLVVTILISEHLSKARTSRLASDLDPRATLVDAGAGAPITSADLRRTAAPATPAPAPSPTPVEPTRVADAGSSTVVPTGPIAGPSTDLASSTPGGRPVGMEPVTDTTEPVTLTQGRTPPRDVGTSPTGPSIGSALDRLEAQLRSGGMPVAGQVDRLGGQPAGSAPGAEGEGSSVPTAPVGPVGPVGPDGAGAAPGRGVPTPQVTPVAPERFHTVKDGETLFQITKKYYGDGNRWKKLMEANPGRVGKNGEVRPGVRIMLPANEVITGKPAPASVAGNTGTARTVTTPTPTPTVPPTGPARTSAGAADRTPGNAVVPAPSPATSRTYTVVAGDTLSEISRKTLGTSKRADEIFALNKLKDRNSIFVGMKLVLPEK